MALDYRWLLALTLYLGQPGKQLNKFEFLEKPGHLVPVIVAYLAHFQVQLYRNILHYSGQLFIPETLSTIFAKCILQLARTYFFDMVVNSLETAILLK